MGKIRHPLITIPGINLHPSSTSQQLLINNPTHIRPILQSSTCYAFHKKRNTPRSSRRSSQTQLRIPHIRNTHHNHSGKPGAAFTNAPASAKTSHIQGATAPHRHNVQPGTTAAYRHKSIPSRPPQSSTLKKARGVCRGAVALRPLCGFSTASQSKKNQALCQENKNKTKTQSHNKQRKRIRKK